MTKSIKTLLTMLLVAILSPTFAQKQEAHFHKDGKQPSKYTLAVYEEAKMKLPFEDTRDFEEAQRGFIAGPNERQIKATEGHIAWDHDKYSWIDEKEEFNSVHPSLVRQTKLNNHTGLYEVIPGIYQVRNFDLSNITFIKGETGWIVFDPLLSEETAAKALELVNEHLGEYPVTGVVYSHNHADHFAGVRSMVDEADVRSGKIPIIAPNRFMEEAVAENVYAGAAMNRRGNYQYGTLLPSSQYGHAGQGLGQGTSAGVVGLIEPTILIVNDIEEHIIDGVRMVFQNTPNTEAPAEMNTYFPDMKALWMAENINATMHNIYTLRGAPVRDALNWSKEINNALYLFGQEAEVMFTSHHWPRWSNERVQEVMKGQRDLYANLNNQVLHYANQGVTINEIHNVYEQPESISNQWYNRGYHGSTEHNSRGVINKYLGYWDVNPATLIPLNAEESAPLYVEMMGGAKKIMAKGSELFQAGKYKEASEILNKLLYAEPQNKEVKMLLADVYEQIGYQQENPGLRNSFLNGAYELRSGLPKGDMPNTFTADLAKAMSTELFFEFLAITIDPEKAEDMNFIINLQTPDNGEKFVIEMNNATLTVIEGYSSDSAILNLEITRLGIAQALTGSKDLNTQVSEGAAKAEGKVEILKELASSLVKFTPDFEVLPGTLN